MPNIFQRLVKGVQDLLGIGAAPPPPPPPPPTAPPPSPEEPEEEYYPPEEEYEPPEQIDIPGYPPSQDIRYYPREGNVLGRWEVGISTFGEGSPPTLGDVEELLRVADDGRNGEPFYTYIIYGVLAVDSPDAAKVRDIEHKEPGYLGFVVPFENAWFYFGGADTVEDYFNDLLSITNIVWERVDTVQVLDKRKP